MTVILVTGARVSPFVSGALRHLEGTDIEVENPQAYEIQRDQIKKPECSPECMYFTLDRTTPIYFGAAFEREGIGEIP